MGRRGFAQNAESPLPGGSRSVCGSLDLGYSNVGGLQSLGALSIQYLVSRIIYSQPQYETGHGLFPKDDISKRNSTESPVIWTLRVYAQKLMGESITRLKRATSKTLKGQITATGPYRYRLEGIAHVPLHIKTIETSIKNPKYYWIPDGRYWVPMTLSSSIKDPASSIT